VDLVDWQTARILVGEFEAQLLLSTSLLARLLKICQELAMLAPINVPKSLTMSLDLE
jgi:hypothetical protein